MFKHVKVAFRDSIIQTEINHQHDSLAKIKIFIKDNFEEFYFGRNAIIVYPDFKADMNLNSKREKLVKWLVKSANMEQFNPIGANEILSNYKKQIKIKILTNDLCQDITTIRFLQNDSNTMMIEVKKDTINIILNYIKTRFLFHLVRYEKDQGRILVNVNGKGFEGVLKALMEKRSIAGKKVLFLYSKAYIDSLMKQAYRRQQQSTVEDDIRTYMAKIKTSYTVLRLDAQVRDMSAIKRQYYKLAKRFHPDNYYNHPESTLKYYENQFLKVKDAYETLKEYVEKKSA